MQKVQHSFTSKQIRTMKKILTTLVLTLFITTAFSQTLKPYILATVASGEIKDAAIKVKSNLEANGFNVVGEYMPVKDPTRWVIVVAHPELDKAVQTIGGLTGFAATLRIGLTKEENDINISYTNPPYWGNAYYRDNFPKVSKNYNAIDAAFKASFSGIGAVKETSFGSEDGESIDDLRKYHYMMAMPYFDDTKKLAEFDSYNAAINKIEESLKWGKPGVIKVYRYNVPGKELTLYGFGLSGDKGEENFMPKIDISSPKHTAFLPYELLVMGGEVHILHGRFRIALSFPDLSMGTFTKIMSTPGDIEDLLKQLVED